MNRTTDAKNIINNPFTLKLIPNWVAAIKIPNGKPIIKASKAKKVGSRFLFLIFSSLMANPSPTNPDQ